MKQIPVVEMIEITKKFGQFTANNKINLTVNKGEVLALLGENGAGKSTLMNILYGLYTPTSGKIKINGEVVQIKSPTDAIKYKIGMVHQHFMLVKPFTVTENIILGKENTRLKGILDLKKAREEIVNLSEKYGLRVNPDSKIENITVGMQQRVEILKVLYRGADILILDEPTAVLTPQEIVELGKIVKNLTKEGKSVIIISHKLKEIKEFAQRCTIIRRGKLIETVDVCVTSEEELASKMVGRDVSFILDKPLLDKGKTLLKIENLNVNNNKKILSVKDLSFEVKAGEILGIAGIDGNGQTELVEAITGLRNKESGSIFIKDKEIKKITPKLIFEEKIAHIPEDRHKHGLVLEFDIQENMVLQEHDSSTFSKHFVIKYDKVKEFSENLIKKFDVRPPNCNKKARDLSGGNQQKVIIAREVSHDPDVLIAVQPTRGLDVGAIEFVHQSLIDQRNRMKAVLLISLELDEVMNLADRIAVIFEGKIVEILEAKNADVNQIGLLMSGGMSNG